MDNLNISPEQAKALLSDINRQNGSKGGKITQARHGAEIKKRLRECLDRRWEKERARKAQEKETNL